MCVARSFFIILLLAGPATAGMVQEFVTPNEIVKTFDLGSGIVFDVVLSFEDATGLESDSLAISAQLIDLDAVVCTVCLRMPQNVFIPGRFPVLLTIEPDGEGFTFRGKWSLEIVTEKLQFSANTPLRLFYAPNSVSPFEDITLSTGLGSYRVRGFSGSFSEFVVAADLRPLSPVVDDKFDRVDTILDTFGSLIDMTVLGNLSSLLDTAESFFDQGNPDAATAAVNNMLAIVTQNSGTNIPDGWDPNGSALSLAGKLRGALRSLRFSLALVERADTPEAGSVRRTFDLGGGISGTAILRFDEAFDIDLENPAGLGFSAHLIDPDDFVNRLPADTFIPDDFPVLIKINPAGGQSFSSSFSLEVITDNLRFVGESPLRLFKAPNGGNFADTTESFGVGSYRVRGFSGSFSEFVIVSDQRPIDSILTSKFDGLEAFLDTHTSDIPQSVRNLFNQARSEFENDEPGLAMETLDDFVDAVDANRITIPAVWLPNSSVVNVAGTARSLARSLHFSLVLKDSPITEDPADVNRDGVVDAADVFIVINRVFGTGAKAAGSLDAPSPEADHPSTPNP